MSEKRKTISQLQSSSMSYMHGRDLASGDSASNIGGLTVARVPKTLKAFVMRKLLACLFSRSRMFENYICGSDSVVSVQVSAFHVVLRSCEAAK
jgi:hypothetical protein